MKVGELLKIKKELEETREKLLKAVEENDTIMIKFQINNLDTCIYKIHQYIYNE